MSNYLHILSALEERPWAITPRMLQTMLEIVDDPGKHEAVAAKLGRPLANSSGGVTMRGSIAVMAVDGPIFRYANLMTEISGATSVQMLALDFDAALNNPFVEQIVLHINSPGGEFDGINSMADQIRAGVAKKPVLAFIDGIGASAAYWLASAASLVWSDESSWIGSIGVVANIRDSAAADEKRGVKNYKIISSQSPRKQPSPASEEGLAQIQSMIDEAAALFISRVADFRGFAPEKVAADFGRGGVLTPKPALAAGMIDGIDSFEGFMRSLEAAANIHLYPAVVAAAALEEPMSAITTVTGNSSATPVVAAITTAAVLPDPAIVAREAREAERGRIKGIVTCDEAKGRELLAHTLAFETDHDPETAKKILTAAVAQAAIPTPAPKTAFERHMAKVLNPVVGAAGDVENESPEAEVANILRFVPKTRQLTAARS